MQLKYKTCQHRGCSEGEGKNKFRDVFINGRNVVYIFACIRAGVVCCMSFFQDLIAKIHERLAILDSEEYDGLPYLFAYP